ncbi:MAG: glycoside hydrolase 43 family protein [Lachnospiraceae bacterium]|nr:glycoside hydrolase 43 family protein [Lachnospiraceae bacterium]
MAYNPILKLDYPDLDVIRVEDTYYMISTTMYFIPGGVILRSYDLIHWEIATYVYDVLEDTPAARLENGKNIYGQGMWAASLRYHKGTFYVCFVANDTGKTYLFHSKHITGPWHKQSISGFYHDCSLLFDEDDRVYIAYGNTDIRLTELLPDLSGPKPGGLDRILLSDNRKQVGLGYEGAHLYKIHGKYYLFLIHWPNHGTCRRTEACFVSTSLEGTFVGRDILDDDMGYRNAGVAQGGIVDTPDGSWYAMLFQDAGALGRIPVLVPLRWEDDFPVLGNHGKVPKKLKTNSTRPNYRYAPLYASDDFSYTPDETGQLRLNPVWQWNHIPNAALWSVRDRHFIITTGKLCSNLTEAVNTLTQRLVAPESTVTVTLDGSGLNDGDFAGLAALQGCYGLIALTRSNGQYFLVTLEKNPQTSGPFAAKDECYDAVETGRIPVSDATVTIRLNARFTADTDTVSFSYQAADGSYLLLGTEHRLYFKLDHFTGCRAALFAYSTQQVGGSASFSHFRFEVK